jgi:diacylglycerol kinase
MRKFHVAFKGLVFFFKNELNAKIHAAISIMVIVSGFYFKLNLIEWGLISISIALVFTAEIINTAIEKAMDLVHPEENPYVGIIKDVAAGAVLFASIMSAVIGLLVFVPHLM